MFIARYKHIVPSGRIIANRLIALTITLSFIATLVPIAIASASKSSTMPCCVGKDAGHCESGIPAQKFSLPEPDPMCGLTTPEAENDGHTIVAEPSPKESHHSQGQTAESASLSQQCHTDCCACFGGLARNQRERGTAHTNSRQSWPSKKLSYLEASSLLFLSDIGWEQASPRGPPVTLL
jgi:hypothetical protein